MNWAYQAAVKLTTTRELPALRSSSGNWASVCTSMTCMLLLVTVCGIREACFAPLSSISIATTTGQYSPLQRNTMGTRTTPAAMSATGLAADTIAQFLLLCAICELPNRIFFPALVEMGFSGLEVCLLSRARDRIITNGFLYSPRNLLLLYASHF